MFEGGREDRSPINRAENHWFVMAIREGIGHDFFHYFLHKTDDLGETLTEEEKERYQGINNHTRAWHG